MSTEPLIGIERGQDRAVVRLSGDWTAAAAARLEAAIEGTVPPDAGIEIDLAALGRLDTLGARLIERLRQRLSAGGARVTLRAGSSAQRELIEEVGRRSQSGVIERAPTLVFVDWLADVGEKMRNAGIDVVAINAFLGQVLVTLAGAFLGRGRFRGPAIVTQMERMILRGVPIVVLISFVVGVIVAQQTIFQLQRFGATTFVVDLLGVLMLREVGLLLAAIMVAGRSGSAITAELGSMRMREEVDALRVMGLNPIEVLVLPRLIALVVGLPLLAFIAAMAGLFGGGLTAWLYGGITPATFIDRLQSVIGLNTFLVGLIKAPFMGLMIGLIACNEGFRVEGSAESLGRRTTISVVKAIFMVILVDGLFAMFFAAIRY